MNTSPPAPLSLGESRTLAWLGLLLLMIFCLIMAGGTVRLTGSGLSIPEWPIINGSLLPPISADDWQTVYNTYHREILHLTDPEQEGWISMTRFRREFFIEYTHRFIVSAVSIVLLATAVTGFRHPAVRRRIGGHLAAALGLLVFQAVLGGIVVMLDLRAESVAAHLTTGFAFMALVIWMMLRLVWREDVPAPSRAPFLGKLAAGAALLALLQVGLGGLVAGTKAGLMFKTFPKYNEYWIPPGEAMWLSGRGLRNLFENQVLLHFTHRTMAYVVFVVVFLLIAKSMRAPFSRGGRYLLRAAASILVLQMILGIQNVLLGIPTALALAHLGTGALLFAVLVAIAFEALHSREIGEWEQSPVPAKSPLLIPPSESVPVR